MKQRQIAFLARARGERLAAHAKAARGHRGQADASAALRSATTRLLAAELRCDRPRSAGRFAPLTPAEAPDLFAGG